MAYGVAALALLAAVLVHRRIERHYERDTLVGRLENESRTEWRVVAVAYENALAGRGRACRETGESPYDYLERVFGPNFWIRIDEGPPTPTECPQLFWC